MLTAVEFDNEPSTAAGEVGDVGADFELAREARSDRAQDVPEFNLFGGGVVAETARAVEHRGGVGDHFQSVFCFGEGGHP